jgi:hypothetical protein
MRKGAVLDLPVAGWRAGNDGKRPQVRPPAPAHRRSSGVARPVSGRDAAPSNRTVETARAPRGHVLGLPGCPRAEPCRTTLRRVPVRDTLAGARCRPRTTKPGNLRPHRPPEAGFASRPVGATTRIALGPCGLRSLPAGPPARRSGLAALPRRLRSDSARRFLADPPPLPLASGGASVSRTGGSLRRPSSQVKG